MIKPTRIIDVLPSLMEAHKEGRLVTVCINGKTANSWRRAHKPKAIKGRITDFRNSKQQSYLLITPIGGGSMDVLSLGQGTRVMSIEKKE
ncbi:MAG: hypothetical protein PHW52_01665 [Candidatus Pacebacteria bacterium]|nr:hypothetical protein [Candidatus Paceibacterota bacterium]